MRSMRSRCSTATRSPIGPPQSCTTTVAPRRSSSSNRRQHRLRVAVVAVPADVGGLVRAPEARQVGGDAAVAGVAHRRHHLAPQERPGRLAVKEHDRGTFALVEVREPQPLVLAVGRLKREVRKPLEQLVGGAYGVGHRRQATSAPVHWPVVGAHVSRSRMTAMLRPRILAQRCCASDSASLPAIPGATRCMHPNHRPARYGPSTIACAASDATVTSITPEKRSHAIRFSAWRRSSMAWKATACEGRT